MKSSKLMIEIIFISLAGLITVGLSVNSLLKSDKQESQLKEKQNQLSAAQESIITNQTALINLQEKHSKELKDKSDEVIRLQGLLQDKSDVQLKVLDRIKNPIPESLNIMFSASLVLSKDEFSKILAISKMKFPERGNLLPFDYNKTNDAFDKINALKDVSFNLTIFFEKDGKLLKVLLKRLPIAFLGYNANNSNNAIVMSIQESSEKILFEGFLLETKDITTNYKTPSLLDFNGSKVKITYDFFYPQLKQIGSIPSKMYVGDNREYVTLDLQSVSLLHKNYSIDIKGLKKIDSHTFESIWSTK